MRPRDGRSARRQRAGCDLRHALRDHRDATLTPRIFAHGTSLNGRSFDGRTIVGPKMQLPDYEVTNGTIQF